MISGKSFALAGLVGIGVILSAQAQAGGSGDLPYSKQYHRYQTQQMMPGMQSGRSATESYPAHRVYRAGEGSATNNNLDLGNSGPN